MGSVDWFNLIPENGVNLNIVICPQVILPGIEFLQIGLANRAQLGGFTFEHDFSHLLDNLPLPIIIESSSRSTPALTLAQVSSSAASGYLP